MAEIDGATESEVVSITDRRRDAVASPNAWLPPVDMDRERWEEQGRWLGSISRCSQWWIGDWVRFGASAYGEKYLQASKITGYDEHSLRNIAYVASRFAEVSRRRDNLSFSHHAELAPLPAGEQDSWLERAERERLSVLALRRELRALRLGAPDGGERREPDPPAEQQAEAHSVRCPHCGHTIELAAEAGAAGAA